MSLFNVTPNTTPPRCNTGIARTENAPPEELDKRRSSFFAQPLYTCKGEVKVGGLFIGHIFWHTPQSTHLFC